MKNNFLSFVEIRAGGRHVNVPEITPFGKVITMILFLFTFGIGQMWGESATITIGSSTSTSYAATFTSSSTSTHVTANATSFTKGSGVSTSNSTYDKATAPYSVKYKPSSNLNTNTYSDANSISAQFTVASGYTFAPSAISATIVTEAADYTYQAVLTDGTTTYTSSDVSSSANGKSTFSFTSLSGKALSGTITFKIWYKSTAGNKKFFVVNLPITITGTVASAAACTEAPAAPSALAASDITGESATLTITDDNTPASYDIYYSKSETAPEASTPATTTTTTKSKSLTGLDGSSNYYAWVRAVCDASHKSTWVALTGNYFTTLAAASKYDVNHTLSGNVKKTSGETGTKVATEGVDYDAVFAIENVGLGYSLPSTISVTIGGDPATVDEDYTWNASTGAFQVPAAKVTGDIVVTIAGVAPVKTFKSTYTDFTQVGETNAYYSYLSTPDYVSYAQAGWMVYGGADDQTGSKKLLIDPATDEPTSGTSKTYAKIKQEASKYMEFYVTGITSVKFYFYNDGSDSRTIKYKLNGGDETDLVAVTNKTSNAGLISLNSATQNTIRVYASGDVYICAMKVTVAPSCSAPTSPAISGTTSYTEGDDIELTASATGTDGSTTYAWYKGADWATASATSSIGSAAKLTIENCATSDAGTYWCEISNGTGCEVQVSKAITVAEATAPTYAINFGSMSNGSVSANPNPAAENANVELTISPSTGYRLATLTATGDVSSSTITVTNNQFTMPAEAVTVNATFELIPTYTVTLDPNKGTIESYDGWTLSAGKYTKTVAEGTELDLLVFIRSGYQFMTWRAGGVDKTSPITVSADIELKAIWGTEEEVTIYSWESPSGTAIEEGGTATHYNGDAAVAGNTRVNYANKPINGDTETEYYTISLNGNDDYSSDHIRIALDQNIKAGDEVKMTAYYTKNSDKSAAAKMNTQDGTKIFEGDNLPNLYSGGSPVLQTYTVPEGINTDAIKLTRYQTGSGTFITKLVITRTEVVEEMDPAEQPTITTQPTGGTYEWNADATQTVMATVSDGGTLSYQWYKKGDTDTKVGTNSASYVPTVSGTYYVIVTNTKTGYAKTTKKSNEVSVTINERPSYKVTYYDGAVKLGEETVNEGAKPTHAGDFDDLPMATFQGWFNDADLAPEHAVASIGDEVITAATSYYSKWNKTYASSVDFVQLVLDNAEEDAYKTYDYAEFLSGKGYLLTEGTGNENALDKSNAFDTGLKLKKSTDNKLQFNVEAGRIVKLTVGKINGMSIAINGASATAIPGGTDATHLGVSYYYSANPQAVTIAETSANYNMLRAIAFLDPMTVTYDVATNGGSCATDEAIFTGTALTLPEATKSGWQFDGWFTTANDETETGELVGEAGETYIPSADITLYARFTETTTLATLTDIKVNGTTVKGFAVDKYEYTIELPYKTAVVPTITYTRGYEGDGVSTGEVVTISPNPITEVFGNVTLHVVSEDKTNNNDYVLHFTEAPKDMLCIISAKHTGATTATVTGHIGGTADKSTSGSSKLGNKGHYFGITLAKGTFQAGDVVMLRTATGADTNGDKVRIFKSNAASAENVLVEGTAAMVYGDNYVTLPATDLATIYIRRGTDEEAYNNGWNPYIDVFAVYRPFPQPLLTGMTIDGAVAVVDELDATVYNVTIPAGSELASLDVVPTFLSNDPSQTNGEVTSNEGAWVVGPNTYVVTDKDGDSKSYTINITRDAAVESVSVSGKTTVAAKSQITLTATVLPAEVSNKAVTWSSSDETKATVDANGVVTGKAAGSVTITATSVADGTKKGTLDITVTKFVGTERVYWFAYAADATANGVENNSAVFGSAPTGTTDGAKEITLEEGWVVNTTKKAGSSTLGSFTVPADFTATLYVVVKGSGSSGRYIQLKQSDVVKYTSEEFGSADPTVLKIDGVAAGTYTIANVGGLSNFYLYAAELNSYPLTSVTLEEGFNLRLEQSRTPVFTITPAKAAVASQEWSVVSRTGASDAILNTSTGEITAGTEEGTLTVKVTVTDAFGNEAESGNCVVKIVNIIDQKDVTGSMTWNWTGAGTTNVSIANEEALVLGNYIDGDQWAYLKGTNGDQAYHHESSYGSYQGKGTLSFKTTVPGLVTITARRWSNTPDLKIGEDVILSLDGSNKTSKAYFVPAGEVNIIADATDGMRILKIEFDAEPTVDKIEGSHFGGYKRTVDPQYYGTICLPKAGVMVGATVFEIAYMDYKEDGVTPYKVYYDEVPNGTMQAGMPYIFLAEQSTIGVYYTGTTAVAQEDLLTYHGLHGTLVEMTDMSGTGIYMLYNNKILHSTNSASSLPANRAYIQLNEVPGYGNPGYRAAPAKPGRRRIAMSVNAPQVMTGIEDAAVDDKPVKIMINGELFIIRGEKMYDATGKLVK